MLNESVAAAILAMFGVSESPRDILCLEKSGHGDDYRGIFRIETSRENLVCRLCGEGACPGWLMERQARFSDLLCREGVPVAGMLKVGASLCADIQIEGNAYHVSLEQYLGVELTQANLSTFWEMGSLIGRMHRISQAYSAKIGISYVASAIKTGRASFARILGKASPAFVDEDWVRQLGSMHDELVAALVPAWDALPAGAVHGDLGIYNNLMQTESGLGIIDFNRSGDEAFLGDALSAYYASAHKLGWQERLSSIPEAETLRAFFSGYGSERTLTADETASYPLAAALFDGLFYCKNAIELWNSGSQGEAVERMRMGESRFQPATHPVSGPVLEGCTYDGTANRKLLPALS